MAARGKRSHHGLRAPLLIESRTAAEIPQAVAGGVWTERFIRTVKQLSRRTCLGPVNPKGADNDGDERSSQE